MRSDHLRALSALLWGLGCLIHGGGLLHAANAYYREEDGQSCAGCHGETAEGGGEGALRVPALQPLFAAGGPYSTTESVCSAVRDGTAADGRKLSGLMPRKNLSDEDCQELRDFLTALPTPVFTQGAMMVTVMIRTDPRSTTQRRWKELIEERLRAASSGRGLHGRSIMVTDGTTGRNAPTTLAIDLSGDGRDIDAIAVITRDGSDPEPTRRSIESTVRQEVAAIAEAHPGRSLIIPGVARGDPVWEAAEAVGANIVEVSRCATTVRPLVIVMDEAGALGRTRSCPPEAETFVSLRRIPSARVEQLRIDGGWRGAIGLFAPVPLGETMQSIPERLAAIILGTLREMGRAPRRSDLLRAFGYSWARFARTGDTMFAGTSLMLADPGPQQEHRPKPPLDQAGPRWLAAP